MRRRFTINDEAMLVDRDGYSLGKVVGITIDVPSGGRGKGSSVLGSLPQVAKDSPLAPGVDEVWAHFCQRREEAGKPLRSKDITPSMGRMISKGIKEVLTPGDLMRAIDGLLEWQKQRGGDLDLSRVLQSRPGGRPLREQIEFFIKQSGEAGAHGGTRAIGREEMVKINRLKEAVIAGYDKPHRQEEVERAIAELASRGWAVEAGEEGQVPRFLAP